jgi:RNA polymerase sigma factor (sigma-70 family)
VFRDSTDSDQRLIERARAGDEHAFERLHARYRPDLLAFCRQLTGQREDAEDAVQYTFFVTYREIVETTRALELRPWLFTVARNRCSSLLRRRRAHPSSRPLDALEAPGEPPADKIERREELRDLIRDLQALPEQQREALLLSEIADLRHAEIARIIGVSPAKVKALVFQARRSLGSAREARDADCQEIRSQLATLSGGALRRRRLRRHLRQCDACRAFEHGLTRRRKGAAAVVPVGAGIELTSLGGAQATGGGGPLAGLVGSLLAAGSGAALKGTIVLVAVAGSGLAVSGLSDTPADPRGDPPAIVRLDREAAPQPAAASRRPAAQAPTPASRPPAPRGPLRTSRERAAGGGTNAERRREPGAALPANDQHHDSTVAAPSADSGSADGAVERSPRPEPSDQHGMSPGKPPKEKGGGPARGTPQDNGSPPGLAHGHSTTGPPGQVKKTTPAPPAEPPPVSLPPQAQGNPGGPGNNGGKKEKTQPEA